MGQLVGLCIGPVRVGVVVGFGRVVGYVWGVAVIVQGFLIIEQAPWYGAGAIAVAILVIYGLATTSGWRAEEVSP